MHHVGYRHLTPSLAALAAQAKTGGPEGGAVGTLTAAQSEHLTREIAQLQAKLRSRAPDAEATNRLGQALEDEFGARASSMYSALVQHRPHTWCTATPCPSH